MRDLPVFIVNGTDRGDGMNTVRLCTTARISRAAESSVVQAQFSGEV